MKYIYIYILLWIGCANSKKVLNKKEVFNVVQTQEYCWNNGDINGFMKGYFESDSMQFISKNGITYGWQNTLNKYKKGYPTKEKMGNLKFNNLVYNPLSKTIAQVTGNWLITYPKDSIGGNFSLIFNQINGTPKIIIDHTW